MTTEDRIIDEIYEIKIRCFDPNVEFSRVFQDSEHYRDFQGKFKLPKETRQEMRSVVQAMKARIYHGNDKLNHKPLANYFDSHFARVGQLGFILADCERTEEKLREILQEARTQYGTEIVPIEPSVAYVRVKPQVIPPIDPKDEAYSAIRAALHHQIYDSLFKSKSFEKLKEALKSKKDLPKRSLEAVLRLLDSLEAINIYNDQKVYSEISKLREQVIAKQIPKVTKFLNKQLAAWEKGGQARQIRKYTQYNGVKFPDLPPIETRRDIDKKKAQAAMPEVPLASPPKRKVKRRRKTK